MARGYIGYGTPCVHPSDGGGGDGDLWGWHVCDIVKISGHHCGEQTAPNSTDTGVGQQWVFVLSSFEHPPRDNGIECFGNHHQKNHCCHLHLLLCLIF
jgi:hypothetical protein